MFSQSLNFLILNVENGLTKVQYFCTIQAQEFSGLDISLMTYKTILGGKYYKFAKLYSTLLNFVKTFLNKNKEEV